MAAPRLRKLLILKPPAERISTRSFLVINIISALSGRKYTLKKDLPDHSQYRVRRHGRVYEVIPIHSVTPSKSEGEKSARGKIKGMSPASFGRMICNLSRVERFDGFITLTYPGKWREAAKTPRASKKALSNFHFKLRSRFPNITGGIWILEFQKRGAPHYHIWTIHKDPKLNQSEDIDRFVKDQWQRHSGGKVSNFEPCRAPDAAARYAAKEGGKRFQKDPPVDWDPGRFWGVFGEVPFRSIEEIGIFSIFDLPDYISTNEKGVPYRTNWNES